MFKNNIVNTLLKHLVILFLAILVLTPIIWMLSTSLKSNYEVFEFPPKWIPESPQWNNYLQVTEVADFGKAYLNSIKVSILAVLIQLTTASMAAYAFAKINFTGKNVIFFIFLATLMVPIQVTAIPTYVIFSKIGWLDTHIPLILPPAFLPFGVFLLRQFIKQIPDDLEDAARIDGCNPLGIWWHVVIPLSKPALTALAIFTFLYSWKDFFSPLIFLSSPEKYTLPLQLSRIYGMYPHQWTWLMAATVIAVFPVLILYMFGQRYFIEGIALTGLKG